MDFTFSFITRLELLEKEAHTGLYLPEEIVAVLPKGRLRAQGLLNGVTPFNLAVQSERSGAKFFMVGGPLRREAGIKQGDEVHVQFSWIDTEHLDIPEEFQAALEQDDEARAIFETFTTGKKRGLMNYITSVKNVDSRIKRSLELLYKIKTRQLYSDRSR